MSFFSQTPVQFVPGIGWRTAQVLQELEIYTVDQLRSVPEKMLVELFGPSIRSVIALVSQYQKPKHAQGSTPYIEWRKTTNESVPILNEKKSWFKRLQLAGQFVSML